MKKTKKHSISSVFLVTLAFCLLVVADLVKADPINSITIPANRTELLDLPDSFTNISIKDRAIVRVIKHSDRKVSIVGRKQGRTDVEFTKGGKAIYRANVEVGYDVPAVKMAVRKFFPAEAVDVQIANDAIVLSGAVTDAEIGYRIEQLAKQFAGGKKEPVNVINMMQVRTGQQVMLRVRIGEVTRGAVDLGPQGITNDVKIFDRMVDDGLVRLIAEPSLVAISGESAEFLSGGEVAIPVGDVDEDKIDYKPYGVSVKFTPYVLSQSRIRLTVEPEVSELSNVGSIKKAGTNIPGIISRRAKTTIELAPGESFMVAGLIKDDVRGNVSSVERTENGLGAIFSGSGIKRTETELVISVTPYLVDPMAAKNVKLPTDISNLTSHLEKRFENNLSILPSSNSDSKSRKNVGKSAKGLEGKFGQMVE